MRAVFSNFGGVWVMKRTVSWLPFLAMLLLAGMPQHAQAQAQSFLTSAANVRLRTEPSETSSVVQMLTLGTRLELAEPQRQGEWLPVRTAGGDSGWIAGRLVVPFTTSTYRRVVQQVIASRLARTGDGFAASVELLTLIERVLPLESDPEDAARLQFQRLQALATSLGILAGRRDSWNDDLSAWIASRSHEVSYSEPAGEWLVDRDVILQVHTAIRTSRVADDVAWFMVENRLPGECEGDLLCYLAAADALQGEYLRRSPSGRHVEEAAAQVKQLVGYFTEEAPLPLDSFDPERGCDDLKRIVHSLLDAVRSSSVRDRDDVARQIRRLLNLCPA